jgi:single-strand DNA-binding protein
MCSEEETNMADTNVSLVGNLVDAPEVRFTANGAAVANLRLAVTPRIKDGDTWKDGETSFYRVVAWRQLAEHAGDSLSKGDRVLVIGQLRMNSWENAEGEKRTTIEIVADEIGPSLKWATAKPERVSSGASAKGGQFNDDPPF